jgi:Cu-Zn family superoxide dismutase
MKESSMNRSIRFAALAAAGLLSISTTALAQDATPPAGANVTVAPLLDASGATLGWAAVTAGPGGSATVIVQGLTPGEHGIHLHTTGDCDPAGESPFAGAGGHLNPDGAMHGSHAGDLGNLIADADGDAVYTLTHELTADLLADADGTALVLHADPDDGVTDPSGNSGTRIACAVLFAAA